MQRPYPEIEDENVRRALQGFEPITGDPTKTRSDRPFQFLIHEGELFVSTKANSTEWRRLLLDDA